MSKKDPRFVQATLYVDKDVNQAITDSLGALWGWRSILANIFFTILAIRFKEDVLPLKKYARPAKAALIIHSMLRAAAGNCADARRVADWVSEDPTTLFKKGRAKDYIEELLGSESSPLSGYAESQDKTSHQQEA